MLIHKKTDIRKFAVTAMFCALAYLMTFIFHFRVSFLTFDFKDAILAIAALLFGPLYGLCGAVVTALLETLTFGGDTQVYGLIMNIISSSTFAVTCGVIYKYRRTFGGAVAGVCFSVGIVTGVMMIANIFITPIYMGLPRGAVIAYIPKLLLPFNFCKASINAAATMLIYKPITNALRRAKLIDGGTKATYSIRTLVMSGIAVAVIIVAVLFVLLYLEGAFSIFRS